MKTYINNTQNPINVEWCVEVSHWLTQIHDPLAGGGDPGFQQDTFEEFQESSTLPDFLSSFTIIPGSLIVIDDAENNGEVIEVIFLAAGLTLT